MDHYEHVIRLVADLTPYDRNSRTHSAEQVTQVASSIREWGFTNPVLIDEAGGIVAGHGRVLAAQQLGMDEVPCIVLAGLTEAQRRAYVIADNKLALNAGWDVETLRMELDDLAALDFDISLTGFTLDEIADELGVDPIGIQLASEVSDEMGFTIRCANPADYAQLCTLLGRSKRINFEDFIHAWTNR